MMKMMMMMVMMMMMIWWWYDDDMMITMVGFARRWGCPWNPPAAREPWFCWNLMEMILIFWWWWWSWWWWCFELLCARPGTLSVRELREQVGQICWAFGVARLHKVWSTVQHRLEWNLGATAACTLPDPRPSSSLCDLPALDQREGGSAGEPSRRAEDCRIGSLLFVFHVSMVKRNQEIMCLSCVNRIKVPSIPFVYVGQVFDSDSESEESFQQKLVIDSVAGQVLDLLLNFGIGHQRGRVHMRCMKSPQRGVVQNSVRYLSWYHTGA